MLHCTRLGASSLSTSVVRVVLVARIILCPWDRASIGRRTIFLLFVVRLASSSYICAAPSGVSELIYLIIERFLALFDIIHSLCTEWHELQPIRSGYSAMNASYLLLCFFFFSLCGAFKTSAFKVVDIPVWYK